MWFTPLVDAGIYARTSKLYLCQVPGEKTCTLSCTGQRFSAPQRLTFEMNLPPDDVQWVLR